ncbi:HAD superfamily hydrolase (TIGR01509 family) [Bradyrhizobium sp. GM2.2]|jgi:HAD superfamily hydrolase (TIGR01509 family)|uniref:HAD family hydrolase n=1 Tax=Bradyrhizobium TaxID=374 RepID=UPI00195D36AF|nr:MULTISPECIES: HAD family hydrolase [Bradyrhizobium]MBM7484870.1 HAD superfamily hydrolase (TIGR01509 family) [Bradyrhizobium canariense]MCK1271278.1 HAD family hydrolase [Bradyrhizobium sp. 84]MCK1309000.1 HAD family hydrolase [Bradyrhizobium sp. 45]MCK1320799.1 HAD family hydrolase [Bradyrhizobium sp. 156]MCK1352898.1 HAD family hydrolase [Bradyrhizobium sp. CW7]
MQAEAPAIMLSDAAELVRRAAALIFDVDGTLAETEELHRQAFNHAFARHGLDWQWDRAVYKDLLRVTGGKERIRAHHERLRIAAPLSDVDIAELHRIKTAHYAGLVQTGCCPLRPGVTDLLVAAKARRQRLAIATTTSHANIDALLSRALGKCWAADFDAIVAGDDVRHKKPAPDVYVETLARLKLNASDCVAIEDSANGLTAASRANIPVLITRSMFFRDDDFSQARVVLDDLSGLG